MEVQHFSSWLWKLESRHFYSSVKKPTINLHWKLFCMTLFSLNVDREEHLQSLFKLSFIIEAHCRILSLDSFLLSFFLFTIFWKPLRFVTKSYIGRTGVHVISDITNPKIYVKFLLFAVAVTSFYCPFSKDNDPVCACWRKICTIKALLKLHLKARQNHSYDAKMNLKPKAENVSAHTWRTMFNSLNEGLPDGYVWNHLWVKVSLVKSFHLLHFIK